MDEEKNAICVNDVWCFKRAHFYFMDKIMELWHIKLEKYGLPDCKEANTKTEESEHDAKMKFLYHIGLITRMSDTNDMISTEDEKYT